MPNRTKSLFDVKKNPACECSSGFLINNEDNDLVFRELLRTKSGLLFCNVVYNNKSVEFNVYNPYKQFSETAEKTDWVIASSRLELIFWLRYPRIKSKVV